MFCIYCILSCHPDRLKTILQERYSDMVLDMEEATPLDEVYVELRLQQYVTEILPETLSERDVVAMEKLMQQSPVVKLPELFDKMRDRVAPKKVLIRGKAGVGKSTLVKRIASQWAAGKVWKDVFSYVFVVTLREYPQDIKLTLRQLLLDTLPLSTVEKEAAFEEICRNPKCLLILGDGLDEIPYHHTSSHLASDRDAPTDLSLLLSSIVGNTMLPGATVVVTSRPTQQLPMKAFGRTVELYGFPRDSIIKYVSMFCAKNTELEYFIKKTFEENHELLTTCYIPLQCQFVCKFLADVHTQGMDGDVPVIRTVTELYVYMTINMARMLHPRLKYKEVEVEDVLQVITEPYRKYAALAKQCVMTVPQRIIFSEEDLNNVGLREDSADDMQCGIMMQSRKRHNHVQGMYRMCWSFNHLTLQDFFSAIGLLLGSDDDIWQLLQDESSIRKHEVIIGFIAGLSGDMQNEYYISQLLSSQILLNPRRPRDLIKKVAQVLKHDPLKVVTILHETQDPNLVDVLSCGIEIKSKKVFTTEMHALSWVLRQCKCPVTNLW